MDKDNIEEDQIKLNYEKSSSHSSTLSIMADEKSPLLATNSYDSINGSSQVSNGLSSRSSFISYFKTENGRFLAFLISLLIIEWIVHLKIQRVRIDTYLLFEFSLKNWTAVLLKFIILPLALCSLVFLHRRFQQRRRLKVILFWCLGSLLILFMGFFVIPQSCCSLNTCYYRQTFDDSSSSVRRSAEGQNSNQTLFSALAIADPQFLERMDLFHSTSLDRRVNLNEKLVIFTRDFNNWCRNPSASHLILEDHTVTNRASLMFEKLRISGGCPVKLLIPGDLTEHGESGQHMAVFAQLEDFEYFYGLNRDGVVGMEVYEGLGNHDYFTLYEISPSKSFFDRMQNSTSVSRLLLRRNLYRTNMFYKDDKMGFYVANLGPGVYVINLQACLHYFVQEGPDGVESEFLDKVFKKLEQEDPFFSFMIMVHYPECLSRLKPQLSQKFGSRFLAIVHGHIHIPSTQCYDNNLIVNAPSPKYYWRDGGVGMSGLANSSFTLFVFENGTLLTFDVSKELGSNSFSVRDGCL
jgi:hypothetical protein